MFRLGCFFVLVILISIPLLSRHFLPWWGPLVVVAAEVLLLVFIGPKVGVWAMKRIVTGLFMTKSRVLRGAMVSVERVEPTTKPADDTEAEVVGEDRPRLESDLDEDADADEEDEAEREERAREADLRYYLVEFRITPKPGASKMAHYEPSELLLVPHDAVVSMDDEDPTADERSGNVHTIHAIDDDTGETIEIDKITGPARLRAVFACPPSLRGRVKFRYYFETFGELMLGV